MDARDGYRVEHPQDWKINPGDVEPACSYFDPNVIELPHAQEAPLDIAVSIRREPAGLDQVTGDDPTIEVLERETTEVDGRHAVQRLTESTGGGLRPEGIRANTSSISRGRPSSPRPTTSMAPTSRTTARCSTP